MLRRCERRRGDANGAGPTPAFLLARSHLRLGRRLRTAKNIVRGGKESPSFLPLLALLLALRRRLLLFLLFLHSLQLRVNRRTGPLLLGLLPDPDLRGGDGGQIGCSSRRQERFYVRSGRGKPPDVTPGKKPRESPRASVARARRVTPCGRDPRPWRLREGS